VKPSEVYTRKIVDAHAYWFPVMKISCGEITVEELQEENKNNALEVSILLFFACGVML